MSCIMCGRAAGFNRAVLDVLSGQQLGRLCRNCELDHFGRRLELDDVGDDTCAFCHRDGHYAAPKFVATLVDCEAGFISETAPAVTETTPQICEYHVDLMEQFDDVPETVATAESEGTGVDDESP